MDDPELLGQFLVALGDRERRSPHTIRAYRSTLRRFWDFLERGGPLCPDRLRALTPADFRRYLGERRAGGLSNRSAAREVSVIRAFFRWLRRTHGVTCTPGEHLSAPRVERRVPRPVPGRHSRAAAVVALDRHAHLDHEDVRLVAHTRRLGPLVVRARRLVI